MNDILFVDSNLLLLLVVGKAGTSLIRAHKRLGEYDAADFQAVETLRGRFPKLGLVPNVVTEVSNLGRQIAGPARRAVAEALRRLCEDAKEVYVPSLSGFGQRAYPELGLTDSVLISLLEASWRDWRPTLLTADRDLFNLVHSRGLSALDFVQFRASRAS